ncbi:MAG: RsmD family RNA methyltransferase, partial [Candidatus Izemoplasmataceae bacterium]
MRVISGKYRSRTLLEVEDKATRSTKDRVKEALFNALYPV